MEYFALVTRKGLDKMLSAIANEKQIQITKFCIGDGGGEPVTPSETQTALVNQTWIGDITKYSKDGDMVSASTVVPEDVGNFVLREMGLIDSDGDLFAVANVPDTLKTKDSGIRATLNLTISLKIENTNAITFHIISDFDTALDENSANAVQNKVVTQEIRNLKEDIDSIGLVYDSEYHAIELGGGGHSGGGGGGYTPTAAGPDKLGCIKVGPDFSITEDGMLSINKASTSDIDNLFTEPASISETNDVNVTPKKATRTSKTAATALAQISAPSNVGDTARYIKDGGGVYHPVEDTAARQAAEDNANAIEENASAIEENASAIKNKVDKETGKGLSTNDFTTAEKNKLKGIDEGANKTTVDSELSDTSENPLQNKVVAAELKNKANKEHKHKTGDIEGLEDAIDTKIVLGEATSTTNFGCLSPYLNLVQNGKVKSSFRLAPYENSSIDIFFHNESGEIQFNVQAEKNATKNNCSIGIFHDIQLDNCISTDGTISLTTTTKTYEGPPFRDLSEGLVYLHFRSLSTTKVSDDTDLTLNIDGVSYDFDYLDNRNGGRMTYEILKERYSGFGGFVLFSYDNFYSLPKDTVNITVDSALNKASSNPVQNRVIAQELEKKLDKAGGEIDGNVTINGYVSAKVIEIDGDDMFNQNGWSDSTSHIMATQEKPGLMSAADKKRLDSLSKGNYLIAASDTDSTIKSSADYVHTSGVMTSLQAFIDSLPTSAKVTFAPGHYVFNTALKLNKPISIDGSGQGAIIQSSTTTCSHSRLFTVGDGTAGTNIFLRDLFLDHKGDGSGSGNDDDCLIYVDNINGFYLYNTRLGMDIGDTSPSECCVIRIVGASTRNIHIHDCVFTTTDGFTSKKDGYTIDCSRITSGANNFCAFVSGFSYTFGETFKIRILDDSYLPTIAVYGFCGTCHMQDSNDSEIKTYKAF